MIACHHVHQFFTACPYHVVNLLACCPNTYIQQPTGGGAPSGPLSFVVSMQPCLHVMPVLYSSDLVNMCSSYYHKHSEHYAALLAIYTPTHIVACMHITLACMHPVLIHTAAVCLTLIQTRQLPYLMVSAMHSSSHSIITNHAHYLLYPACLMFLILLETY
jgi:hypothetical protein